MNVELVTLNQGSSAFAEAESSRSLTSPNGVWLHPESPKANFFRSRQIDQILQFANAEQGAKVLLGDLNAGFGVFEDNLRQLSEGRIHKRL